jgi:23S rRNA pseudouridine1911/1915/1917 synthase
MTISSARTLNYTVDYPGDRLDKYVSRVCPDVTRSQAEKIIDHGGVTVNGRAAKRGLKLNAGDRIEVNLPLPPPSELKPEAAPLKIVFEDEDLLVIDKPAGLVVYPAPGHPEHTLINYLLARYPALAGLDSSRRPGIVHRLDKDTSGLMLVAKNRPAQLKLAGQFAGRSVLKEYLVLVKGRLSPAHGLIEAPLGRSPANRQRMAVVASGRPATTEYRVREYLGEYTLLEVVIHTGRTHQIRVHLQAIGFPVTGDATYGTRVPFLKRQFLHAHRLGFDLPSNGERVELTSPLPPDLEKALRELK